MDVFAIEKGKALKLSVDEFENRHAMIILITELIRINDFLCMRFVLNVEIQFRLSICMGKK